MIKYLHKDWKTPQTDSVHRGEEIKYWLDEHPYILEYVIIDDDETILEEQKSRFVKTDPMNGMQQKAYDLAKEIFLGQKSD